MSRISRPRHRSLQLVLYVKWYGATRLRLPSRIYGRGHGSHGVVATWGGSGRISGVSAGGSTRVRAISAGGIRPRRMRYSRRRGDGRQQTKEARIEKAHCHMQKVKRTSKTFTCLPRARKIPAVQALSPSTTWNRATSGRIDATRDTTSMDDKVRLNTIKYFYEVTWIFIKQITIITTNLIYKI